jgi:hypothetical protein
VNAQASKMNESTFIVCAQQNIARVVPMGEETIRIRAADDRDVIKVEEIDFSCPELYIIRE